MDSIWTLFFTTIGTAAVISTLAMLFFSMEWRHNLHATNKKAHRVLVGVVFGLFAIYGSIATITVNGVVTNCRDLAALYAGLVGGPVSGIIAAVIGAAFRYFVQGVALGGKLDIALSCTIATLLAGIIGSICHCAVKKERRYNPGFGLILSILVEIIHLSLAIAFGYWEAVKLAGLPMIVANALGMVFCLFMYKKCAYKWNADKEHYDVDD